MNRPKTFIAALCLSACLTPIAAAGTVEIQLENVKQIEGQVMIALFANEEDWKSSDGMDGRIVPVTSEQVSATFSDVPEGTYAIRLFHDVDGDGSLKTGRFGIPSEPYGFSNNAPVRFGPPKFKAASFTVGAEPVTQIIKLK